VYQCDQSIRSQAQASEELAKETRTAVFGLKRLEDGQTVDLMQEEGVMLYQVDWPAVREQLGGNHPAVAAALHNLGVTLMHLEEYQEADNFLKRAIGIFKKVYPEADNAKVAESMDALRRL
jgi:tetratricopeptide (TPR) repeat protein